MNPQFGTDDEGNTYIPFTSTSADVPFANWKITTKKLFSSDGPISIQSVIITSRGEIFLQYAEQINDVTEFPTDGTLEYIPLIDRDEKRSYE